MKSSLSTFILTFLVFKAFSQHRPTDALAEKFVRYYNNTQPDSIYPLFSEEVKKALPLSNLGAVIQQFKSPLGNLLKSEFLQETAQARSYVAKFDKSDVVLYLHFNKQNQLTGFFTGADKRQPEEPGSITVKTPGATIKGTLSLPDTNKKIPVVLLIPGSGPIDRNGNSVMINGKPNYFLKISEALKCQNVAVLRYDKRFTGQSSTSKTEAELRFEDNVNDAVALINFLKKDTRFSKIIVAGHSEGSLVGMLACKQAGADAFISIAGAGYSIDKILKTQFQTGLPPADFKTAVSLIDSVKLGLPVQSPQNITLANTFRPSVIPYMHSWMQYHPSAEIAKLKMPILIVQGSNDIQVSTDNALRLKKASPLAQLKIINGMNHILKEAPADRAQNFATYSKSNLELHPQLIPALSKFINGIK